VERLQSVALLLAVLLKVALVVIEQNRSLAAMSAD